MQVKLMLVCAMGLVLLGLFFFFAPTAYAATCASQQSGDWSTASTWTSCGGGVPQSGDDVIIQSGYTVTVTTPVTFTANNTLAISGTLAIESIGVMTSTVGNVKLQLAQKSGVVKIALSGGLDPAFQKSGNGSFDLSSMKTSGWIEYYGGDQTVTDQDYGGLVISGTGTKTWTFAADRTVRWNGVTVKSANLTLSGSATLYDIGNWQNDSTGTFAAGGITVNFNSNAQQMICGASPTIFNNVTISSTNIVTQSAPITITGSLTVTSGEFRQRNNLTVQGGVQNNATFSASNWGQTWLRGDFTNNGTFTHGSGTVNFDGTAPQIIGGASPTTFYNLNANNFQGVSLNQAITVTHMLSLTNNMETGTHSLTFDNSSAFIDPASTGEVIGAVRRAHTFAPGIYYGFGHSTTNIGFTGAAPSEVTVTVTTTKPSGLDYAVKRTYTLAQTGGDAFSARISLHYADSELAPDIPMDKEDQLQLWRYNGTRWVLYPKISYDIVQNWVASDGVTDFSNWALTNNGAPTSVTLSSFTARAVEQTQLIVLLAMLGLAAVGISAMRLIRKRQPR